jgi:hypothetical protein
MRGRKIEGNINRDKVTHKQKKRMKKMELKKKKQMREDKYFRG